MTGVENKRNVDIRQDHTWKLFFTLSPPAVLGMMLLSLNSLIDAVYIGRMIGEEALAGVSVIMPLSIITMAITSLVSTGSAARLSRAIGENNLVLQEQIFSTAIVLALAVSVVLSIVGYLSSGLMVKLLGGEGMMAEHGARYYRVLISGAAFSVIGVSTNSLIRAEGKTKRAMVHLAVALAVNMLMTPFFIAMLGYKEVEGAALGTITSMAVYSSLNLYYFLSGRASFRVSKLPSFTWNIAREILSIGISGLLVQATQFLRQLVIFRSMATYGNTYDMAFLGIVFRVFNFSVMPAMGIVQAMQPVIGINFGAKNFVRVTEALKAFSTGGFILLILVSLPSLLFPKAILGAMLPDTTFAAEDLMSFRIVVACIPFMTFGSTGMTFFQATGRAKTATYLPLLRNIFIFLPLLLLLPHFIGIKGIYLGICIENIVFSLIAILVVIVYSKQDRMRV